MSINHSVSFFSNTADDTHCFQAALKMILKCFYPEEEYSWEELEIISAKKKDLWTWPTAGLIWLKNKGLETKIISPFNYQSFIKDGANFLISKYGEEVGSEQIKYSDIEQEIKLAKELISKINIDKTIPTLKELTTLLDQGYVLMCNVNSKKLNAQQGYVGHFVVIKGYFDKKLILHDPGLPPQKEREVDFNVFNQAWAYPNDEAKEIYAFARLL